MKNIEETTAGTKTSKVQVAYCEADTLPTITERELATVAEYVATHHASKRDTDGGQYSMSTKQQREGMADLLSLATSRPLLAKTLSAMFTKGRTLYSLIQGKENVVRVFRSWKAADAYGEGRNAGRNEDVFGLRSTLAK